MWLGIDPVVHESESPYAFVSGNPILYADPSGADGEPVQEINNDIKNPNKNPDLTAMPDGTTIVYNGADFKKNSQGQWRYQTKEVVVEAMKPPSAIETLRNGFVQPFKSLCQQVEQAITNPEQTWQNIKSSIVQSGQQKIASVESTIESTISRIRGMVKKKEINADDRNWLLKGAAKTHMGLFGGGPILGMGFVTDQLGEAERTSQRVSSATVAAKKGDYTEWGVILGEVALDISLTIIGEGAGKAVSTVTKGLKPLSLGISYGDEAVIAASKKIKPIDGFLDVTLHGSATGVEIGGELVDHRVLANLIKRNAEYSGQSIRLLSCSTGELPNGLAKNLANKLGVNVLAPNNTLWIYPNGMMTIGGTAGINTGSFNLFTPGGL